MNITEYNIINDDIEEKNNDNISQINSEYLEQKNNLPRLINKINLDHLKLVIVLKILRNFLFCP